jgi:hypothetical protein
MVEGTRYCRWFLFFRSMVAEGLPQRQKQVFRSKKSLRMRGGASHHSLADGIMVISGLLQDQEYLS